MGLNKLFIIAVAAILGILLLSILFSLAFNASSSPSPLFQGSLAVIPIKGEISSGGGGFGDSLSASEVVRQIEQAIDDRSVSGILLDIDSPGGSVVPTKQIVYAIRESEKPVVAYIGEIGASGAYYIAASSDYIIADEDSFTGSIGVVSMVMNVQGLMRMIGVDVNVITEGDHKAMGNPFTEFTEEDRALLQELLAETFEQFKGDILTFRAGKISIDQLNEVADGRIVSGRQALKVNLIDATGSRKEAIQKAAELSGITGEPELVTYRRTEFSLFDLFLGMGQGFGKGIQSAWVNNPRGIIS